MTTPNETTLTSFPTLFSLKGLQILITGGSRGLGLSAASACLQAGAHRVYISSRKASACTSACALLNALPNLAPGARAIPIPADSSRIEEIERLVREVEKHTDHLDVLMANAGATWGEKFDTHSDAAFGKVMDLNVRGVFATIRL
jgi:NAD(P)-dependent dehydrogenase (short-subunit alcohol dehydrogenase family)